MQIPVEKVANSEGGLLRRKNRALLGMVLCALFSVGLGYWLGRSDNVESCDFRAVYFAARTALQHHDPYSPKEFLAVYQREDGAFPKDPQLLRNFRRAVPICVNLPSTLFLEAPFALLPWKAAQAVWMILVPAAMLLATWLAVGLGWRARPRLTVVLGCILLANCELIFQLGNATAIAIALLCVSTWCFVRERLVWLGVLGLAVGLAIKPQEIGLVWLYFVLVGGTFRKRALQSAAITAVICLASVAWIASVSPDWAHELHSNVAATTGRGDLNDAGPTSIGNERIGMVVSLQSVVSFIRDDPSFYNPISYAISGALILFWLIITLRTRHTRECFWLGIAAIVPLTMLPVYHREYDVKLLVLTIPAAAMLSALRRPFGRAAVALTSAAILLTADIPLACLVVLNKSLHLAQNAAAGKIMTVLLARTPTVILLALGVFYAWVYYAQSARESEGVEPQGALVDSAA